MSFLKNATFKRVTREQFIKNNLIKNIQECLIHEY